MEVEINNIIEKNFPVKKRQKVNNLINSITLDHVMAQSEYNLYNTRMAVLHLANGDLNQIKEMVVAAKQDFRDVIMSANNGSI